MEITITKTVQVRQYEPITVSVTDSAPVEDNKSYQELKSKVGACVEDIIVTEIERYKKLPNLSETR